MIRFCLFLCLFFLAAPLSAQIVRTQTGEHADFTRIVLTIPAGSDWKIGKIPEGYGVQVEGVDGFNLNNFFDLIPRDRVSAVRVQDETILALTVPCDCGLLVEEGPGNILIIDVSDTAPEPGAPYQAALFPETPPLDGDDIQLTAVLPRPVIDIAIPSIQSNSPVPRDPPLPSLQELRAQAEEQSRVSGLEAAVAESLSRAATQGLLELSDTFQFGQDQQEPNEPAEFSNSPPPQEPEKGAIRPGIVANTSVDLGLSGILEEVNDLAGKTDCWPDSHVDVVNWATDEPFADQLAERRAALTGEFDRIDPDAVEALAGLYLHFGFGREAIQTFEIDGNNSRKRSAMRSLGQIIDGDPLDDPEITQQISCPGKVAVWAVLASEADNSLLGVDHQFVAREFKLLPEVLQVHLGPRLATRIVALNDPDTAENVLALSTAVQGDSVENALVATDIALERGETGIATQTLANLAETDPHTTPEAVVELIMLQIDQDQPISGGTLSLAETMKFEHRGTALEGDLAKAIISAHLQNAEYLMALQALEQDKEHLDRSDATRLKDAIVLGATQNEKEGPFVEMIFGSNFDGIEPETENLVAARLIGIGFPEKASEFLSTPASGSAMAERRYLRAEAAIKMGDFALAESHLAGLNSERAQSLLSFGPEGVPLATLSSVSQEDVVPDNMNAWRNGNWSALSDSDDELLRNISDMVLDRNLPTDDGEAPLATGRELIANASDTRATLGALIDRFDAPLLADEAQ